MAATLTSYIIPVVLIAVAGILLFGLWTMAQGDNPQRSQLLMRWRVGLQLLAILLIGAAFYFGTR